ncbi:MAG: hypothetical protein M1832_004552 [Thelocarpon impressellum]|nr:MAG: hypothetical protein M1832_004552 [Thelocarpon impressellum]
MPLPLPIPFPLPLALGTDIVHIPRIARLLGKDGGRWAAPFIRRVFAPGHERMAALARLEAARKKGDGGVERWIAGRFAAKEAALKAHSSRRLSFHEVCVEVGRVKPFVVIRPSPPRETAAAGAETTADGEVETERGQVARLSISHDGEYATAVVLAVDDYVEGTEEEVEGR